MFTSGKMKKRILDGSWVRIDQFLLKNNTTKYIDSYFKLSNSIHTTKLSPVSYFKSIFGRQNYCFTDHEKFYIWEFDNYILFVSNKSGFHLEVLDGTSIVKAKDYWKNFLSLLKKTTI